MMTFLKIKIEPRNCWKMCVAKTNVGSLLKTWLQQMHMVAYYICKALYIIQSVMLKHFEE